MSDINNNKFKNLANTVSGLSLGISIVVAVLLGVGIGIGLKNIFNVSWLFWLGVFFGVGAAILNVYKAYKIQQRDLKELEEDIKYRQK